MNDAITASGPRGDDRVMESVRRGQTIVTVYIVLMLAVSVGVIVLFLESQGPRRLPAQVVRLGVTGVLCYFLYRGNVVAKWITVVTSTLAGALAAPMILRGSIDAVVIGGGMAALYLSLARVLIWSKNVNAFLSFQRGESLEPPHPTIGAAPAVAPAPSVEPGELAWLPAELQYLIEPALRCGLTSEWQALEYLERASQDDRNRLERIALRVLQNDDYPRVKKFLEGSDLSAHVECAKLQHFFTLLKHFGLKFERGADEAI